MSQQLKSILFRRLEGKGIGISLDLTVLVKDTEASIAAPDAGGEATMIEAGGNVRMITVANESLQKSQASLGQFQCIRVFVNGVEFCHRHQSCGRDVH